MSKLTFSRVLLLLWMLIPALQYSALGLVHLRPPFWILSFALLWISFSRRGLIGEVFPFLKSRLVVAYGMVVAWKIVSLAISSAPLSANVPIFLDFVLVALVLNLVVPRLFELRDWLFFFIGVCSAVFLASVLLQPFFPVVKVNTAGWDKGSSWLFAHPNIAAMYPLAVFLAGLPLLMLSESGRVKRLALLFCVVSVMAIIPTNARTAEAVAIVAFFLAVLGFLFKSFWVSESRVLVIQRRFILFVFFVVVFFVFGYLLDQYSLSQIDDFSTGRLIFAIYLISTVDNLLTGVGFLPPGDNLLYDKDDYGAGIDGLFVNILYTEGFVGLILFFVLMFFVFRYLGKAAKRDFPYFSIISISSLIFGLTESHFWLLPGPLTMLTIGSAAIVAMKVHSPRCA